MPRLGIEPVSPALASGFLTTGVPRKSSWCPSDISRQYPVPGDLSPLVDPSPHQPTLQSCTGLNKQNQRTNKQEKLAQFPGALRAPEVLHKSASPSSSRPTLLQPLPPLPAATVVPFTRSSFPPTLLQVSNRGS